MASGSAAREIGTTTGTVRVRVMETGTLTGPTIGELEVVESIEANGQVRTTIPVPVTMVDVSGAPMGTVTVIVSVIVNSREIPSLITAQTKQYEALLENCVESAMFPQSAAAMSKAYDNLAKHSPHHGIFQGNDKSILDLVVRPKPGVEIKNVTRASLGQERDKLRKSCP